MKYNYLYFSSSISIERINTLPIFKRGIIYINISKEGKHLKLPIHINLSLCWNFYVIKFNSSFLQWNSLSFLHLWSLDCTWMPQYGYGIVYVVFNGYGIVYVVFLYNEVCSNWKKYNRIVSFIENISFFHVDIKECSIV